MKKIIMILSIACTMFASCSEDGEVAVSRVDINKTTTLIYLGNTEQLSVRIYPDAAAATHSVRWFSDDTSVATVSETGLVRALAVGMTVIRITDEDGKSYPATCAVSVHEQIIDVTGVTLVKPEVAILVNGSEQLNYTVIPLNATNKNVNWNSNNTDVATVDNSGKVTGISTGTATITVTAEDGDGKFTSSCVVTVQDKSVAVTGVAFDEPTLGLYLDDVVALTVTVSPETATNKSVRWKSSDTNVATIDDDGVITALATGTTVITATTIESEFTTTCTVTVIDETGDVTSTGWSTPSINAYEYSMTYMAQVAFRNALSTDPNVEIAAFVGDDIRGHAKLVYESRLNVYLVHLTIYSNSGGGETVVLKAYNPSKKRIYDNCKTFTFQSNTSLGSVTEILNCFP
ncbi:MAG: Ig-like domain-containing protein [Prevotellaceae bacterium]|nr:Ig-like domain-containing protein [Prevotellaceae bacterium]